MSAVRDWKRRRVEAVLVVIIALIGWYISQPHSPDAARGYLHWLFAALAAYNLGAAAWSIISKPARLMLALGYLVLGASMSLQFIADLAPASRTSSLDSYVPILVSIGLLMFYYDHEKNDVAPPR
jgi:hypothetical protein